jgi:hypothetical protein
MKELIIIAALVGGVCYSAVGAVYENIANLDVGSTIASVTVDADFDNTESFADFEAKFLQVEK